MKKLSPKQRRKFNREVRNYADDVTRAMEFFIQPGSKRRSMFIAALLSAQQTHGVDLIDHLIYELETLTQNQKDFFKDLKKAMK